MSTSDNSQIHQIVQRVLARVMGQFPAGPAPVADVQSAPTPAAVPMALPSAPPVLARKVVALGADHGGYDLKESLKATLGELGLDVQDVGTFSKAAVDYPDFAHAVAVQVSTGKAWRGIMIDGAGIGSCIVANKVPGVRAGMAYDLSSASNGREHNDTNVLTLGAGLIGPNLAKQIIKIWLSTEFGGDRHLRRIEKISAVEKQYFK